jgi:hypothetical protein
MKRKKTIKTANGYPKLTVTIEIDTGASADFHARYSRDEANAMIDSVVNEIMARLGENKARLIDTSLTVLRVSK